MIQKLRWVSLAVLLVLLVLFGFFTVRNIRQSRFQSRPEFAAKIIPRHNEHTALEGQRIPMAFRLKNIGQKEWIHTGSQAVLFSYHLQSQNRDMIRFDNRRIGLPESVPPGQSLEIQPSIRAPLSEGTYILEFDLLREGISWFQDGGSLSAQVTLEVKKRKRDENDSFFHSTLEPINQVYKLIRITLEENTVRLEGQSGSVFGFSAGTDYPQIWLRDANTIIPASRYFYDTPFLASWLEEHLFHQMPNGSVYDWIDSQGKMDKNTTETDQETSAVQAAYQVFQILDPDWLEREIQGQSILERLERALEYVLRNRFDETLGLLKGAHTADWGDVDMVDEGQDAIYADERTIWTADIYD
ncbi:MAG: hypothetical protein GF421_03845, partial [Candidatus Aminicenantes bacterium]|nr:hypothetical protein [Candidatus Aminicenantes bacterium]